jgi:cytochrome c-type biogenesis protein CcmH
MILFWAVCAALLVVALLFIVLPLWRSNSSDGGVMRDAANLEILRAQSAELDADLRNGLLTPDGYEQGKHELQARLLEEVKTAEQPVGPSHRPAKILAVILAVLLPLFCVPLYFAIGDTNAMLPQAQQAGAGGAGLISSEAALQKLEKELAKQSENPDGWMLLARSYSELERFSDAERAYGQLVKLIPNEAQLWADYADVYAMSHGRTLRGEPTGFLNKALELDSNNTLALALSGTAAMEREDYAAAIAHWQKLLDLLPPDYPDVQMIRAGAQRARELLATQKGGKEKLARMPADKAPEKSAAGSGAVISGRVALNPALAGMAAPTDPVFIIARAAGEQKFPIAVLRKQVKDLPLQFTLDDSMAMQAQMKLSGFDQVVVVARVAKSGDPVARPGDLQGMTGAIKPGAKDVNIVIDSVVP